MTDSECLHELINYLKNLVSYLEMKARDTEDEDHRRWLITNEMAYRRLLWQIDEMRKEDSNEQRPED